MPPRLHLDHAIVVGGSVAGLLAGRVLSECCERVTVLDRDELHDTPGPRKGVPQAPQTHVVLTKLYEALQELLRRAFGTRALSWLTATTVYPELRWSLTLSLKSALGATTASHQTLDAELLALCRLPWFRRGA